MKEPRACSNEDSIIGVFDICSFHNSEAKKLSFEAYYSFTLQNNETAERKLQTC